ncbi:MAG: hypothetical protein EXR11_02940 [Rhodospirillaceae bacterium]|nr:hypothetical protein [Rhodospirillaceae bacterium]
MAGKNIAELRQAFCVVVANNGIAISIHAVVILEGFIAQMNQNNAMALFKGCAVISYLFGHQPVIDHNHRVGHGRPRFIDQLISKAAAKQHAQPFGLPRAGRVHLPYQRWFVAGASGEFTLHHPEHI